MTRHVNDITETGVSWCNKKLQQHEIYIKDLNHLVIFKEHKPDSAVCQKCLDIITKTFRRHKIC